MIEPKTKHEAMAVELGNRLQAIISNIEPYCDEELNTLEQLARKLIFPVETSYYAYEALAMIATFRKDKPKVHQYFKKSFEKAPNEKVLFAMYAKALSLIGEISKSVKQLDYYLTHRTGDILALHTALNLYIFCGQISKAEKIMQQLKNLIPKTFNQECQVNIKTMSALKQTGIPENVLLDYVESVFQFAVERNIDLRNLSLKENVEEPSSLWYIIYDTSLSSEQYLKYELELAKHSLKFAKEHKEFPVSNLMFFLSREGAK